MLVAQQFSTQPSVPNLRQPITRSALIRAGPLPLILCQSKTCFSTVPAAEPPISVRGGGNDCVGHGDRLLLLLGLRWEVLPKHVAVIMDGNGRWAASRRLPASAGHLVGYRALTLMVELSCIWGIRVLTVFAFSSENWHRPKPEVDFLMMLFENVLKDNLGDLLSKDIRIRIIGDSSKLPKTLQKMAAELNEISCSNQRLDLVVAMSYSGRTDIVQPEDITESHVAQELETSSAVGYPFPDLLI